MIYHRSKYTDWERNFKDAGFHRQKLLSDIFGGTQLKQLHNDPFNCQFMFSLSSADYFFVCPNNEFAEKVAHGGADVYYYHFDHVCIALACIPDNWEKD